MAAVPTFDTVPRKNVFVGFFSLQTAWWWAAWVVLLCFAPMTAPNLGILDWVTWFFAVGCLMVMLAPLAFIREYDIFQPLSFVTLCVGIGTTARTMYILASNQQDVRDTFLRGEQTPFLLPATALMFLGICSLMAGYFLRPGARRVVHIHNVLNKLHRPWSPSRVIAIILFLDLISAAGLGLFIKLLISSGVNPLESISSKHMIHVNGSSSLSSFGYLRLMMKMSTLAFLIAFTWFATGKKSFASPQGIAVIFLGLFAAFPPFFNSSRSEVVIIPMVAMAIYTYGRTRLNMKSIMTAGMVGIVLIGFMGALRADKSDDVVSAVTDTLSTSLFEELVGNYNFMGSVTTAHVMQAMPEKLQYQYGQTLGLWIVAPIPRTVWPDKPDVVTGQIISKYVFGRGFGNGGGIPPNAVSDFYWNLGIPGVILGMFAFGCILRYFYYNALPHLRGNPTALLLYLVTMFPFTYYTSTGCFSQGMIQMLMVAIPMSIMMPFVLKGKKSVLPPIGLDD